MKEGGNQDKIALLFQTYKVTILLIEFLILYMN